MQGSVHGGAVLVGARAAAVCRRAAGGRAGQPRRPRLGGRLDARLLPVYSHGDRPRARHSAFLRQRPQRRPHGEERLCAQPVQLPLARLRRRGESLHIPSHSLPFSCTVGCLLSTLERPNLPRPLAKAHDDGAAHAARAHKADRHMTWKPCKPICKTRWSNLNRRESTQPPNPKP